MLHPSQQLVEITSCTGMKVCLHTLGARILAIDVPCNQSFESVALHYPLDDTEMDLQNALVEDNFYMGATIGPIANRIRGGALTINGEHLSFTKNDGPNSLHSADYGFDKLPWQLTELSDCDAKFRLDLPSESDVYDGKLVVEATYSVHDDSLDIVYEAYCESDCYLNLTNHCYFNLNGRNYWIKETKGGGEHPLEGHIIHLGNNRFLEKDDQGIPTGEALHKSKTIDLNLQPDRLNLDHHQVLTETNCEDGLYKLCSVESTLTGLALHAYSSKPGYQLYMGAHLSEPFFANAGFCIEPQYAPNAINDERWNAPIVSPKDTYRQHIRYPIAHR